jgi:hypothetical protein
MPDHACQIGLICTQPSGEIINGAAEQNGGSARGRQTFLQLRSVRAAVANIVPNPQRAIGRVGASDSMLIERFRSVLTERRREIAK